MKDVLDVSFFNRRTQKKLLCKIQKQLSSISNIVKWLWSIGKKCLLKLFNHANENLKEFQSKSFSFLIKILLKPQLTFPELWMNIFRKHPFLLSLPSCFLFFDFLWPRIIERKHISLLMRKSNLNSRAWSPVYWLETVFWIMQMNSVKRAQPLFDFKGVDKHLNFFIFKCIFSQQYFWRALFM